MFRRPQGLQSLIRALPNSSTFLRRFQSTQSGSSQSNLKADIRALYRKVHPDLFHEYPDERRTNETSLKHLQNYLSQVGLGIGGRGGDGGGGGGGAVDSETRPGALKLQFYVRDAGGSINHPRPRHRSHRGIPVLFFPQRAHHQHHRARPPRRQFLP